MPWPFESLCIFGVLYAKKIDFPVDFNDIQDSKIKQVFAWVQVHLLDFCIFWEEFCVTSVHKASFQGKVTLWD